MVSLRSTAYLIVGVLPFVLADTTQTFQTCTTKLGPSSKASVGSTTYALTVTFTATQKITSTPTVTITPATSTVQSTVTSTSTITELSTTTSTIIIPTPSGFIPINGGASKRSPAALRFEQRGKLVERAGSVCSKASLGPKGPVYTPALYPSTVTCGRLVEIVKTITSTSTAQATTTTAPTPVSTNIVTVSTSVTTTVTVAAPAQTSYAACAADNMVSGIGTILYTPPIPFSNVLNPTAASAYDCCVLCQTTPNCAGSFFSNGYCELDLGSSCASGSGTTSIANVYVQEGGPAIAMNGPCGMYTVLQD